MKQKLRDEDLLTHEKMRTLVEESPVGAYLIREGRVVYGNPRFYEIFGYTKEEFAGMDLFDVVHPDDLSRVLEAFWRLLNGGEGRLRFEYRTVRKDGTVAHVEAFGSHTFVGGKAAVMGSVVDITGRKRLEREKADFFAMVTHDLKSPITAILGYSELIMQREKMQPGGDTGGMASAIRNCSFKLMRLVEDFLTVSQADSGKLPLKAMPGSIAALIDEAVGESAPAAAKKRIRLTADVPDGIPPVMFDRKQMGRALSNLLQNALSYTQKGSTVSVRARAEEGLVKVSVSDDGPGIQPEELGRVFDRYYRSPGSAGVKGSGLGLAIVKAVAEAHGGRAEAESPVGCGATFSICIPLKKYF